MSEASKKARSAMRDKARRLTAAGDGKKVDASDWTPPAAMNANKKTGMRPVSPRTYKLGGRVQGDRGPKRSDKAPRGNVANEISTRDTKQANRDKFGSPHIGGMKKGGVAHDDTKQDKALIKKMVKPSVLKRDAKCGGGRMADGGAADADRVARLKAGDPTAIRVKKVESLPPRKGAIEELEGRLKREGKQRGGSVAGGERPEGGRIPRASGGKIGAARNAVLTAGRKYGEDHPKTQAARDAYNDVVAERTGSRKMSMDGAASKSAMDKGMYRPDSEKNRGGRTERASGGRTKGKTNINIVVNPAKPDQNAVPPSGPVRPPVMPPPPPPAPPMTPPPGAPPPNMPPPSMMAGAGGPPPMRARGGRLGMNRIGGAGGGLGRLEKANLR